MVNRPPPSKCPASSARVGMRPLLAAAIVAAMFLAGCRPAWHLIRPWNRAQQEAATAKPPSQKPSGAKSADLSATAAETLPPSLLLDTWVPAFHPKEISARVGLRWRNPGLDELLAAPRDQQPDF